MRVAVEYREDEKERRKEKRKGSRVSHNNI